MRKCISPVGFILIITLLGQFCHAQTRPSDDKPPVVLGQLPKLLPHSRPSLTDAEVRHIKSLIASLANLDKPDFGLSATLSGSDFAPIPGQEQVGTLVLLPTTVLQPLRR
jgi:hypothetical protein